MLARRLPEGKHVSAHSSENKLESASTWRQEHENMPQDPADVLMTSNTSSDT